MKASQTQLASLVLSVGIGVFGACSLSIRSLSAQCDPIWQPRSTIAGLTATTFVKAWDPDGPGPEETVVVAGGPFAFAGNLAAHHITAWHPSTQQWCSLGAGLSGVPTCATTTSGHALIVAESEPTTGIMKLQQWDGANWSTLSAPITGGALALALMPNGDIVVAGLVRVGSVFVPAARWDGASWSSLPGMPNIGSPTCMTQMPNGDLVFGNTGSMIRWNGSSWSFLQTGLSYDCVTALPNGDIVAAYSTASGSHGINRWNGSSWSSLGAANGRVLALEALTNGDLVAGGEFTTVAGVSANRIARWNGATWSAMGSGMSLGVTPEVRTLASLPNGDVVASGDFRIAGDVGAANIARWDGTSWSALTLGINDLVTRVATAPNGDVFVGGSFQTIGDICAHRIARWDGTNWCALGAGTDAPVNAIAILPNGDVVAAGEFTVAGGASANHIARWDGSAWYPLAGGTNGPVSCLAVLGNGDVVAGGVFTTAGAANAAGVARWDGAFWHPLGSGTNAAARSLAVLANGDLVALGDFAPGGHTGLAHWNGSSWLLIGTGSAMTFDAGTALYPWKTGLVASGLFLFSNGRPRTLMYWDGTNWSALGDSGDYTASAFATLPNGDLLVGGSWVRSNGSGGQDTAYLGRWNGSAWSLFFSGPDSWVHDMASLPNGDVVVGGAFGVAGGLPTPYFTVMTTPCPATAAHYGVGCSGSGGTNCLAATTLPWLDTTFHATGLQLPANSVVAALTSTEPIQQGATPLSSMFAIAGAGCDLLVTPDIWELLLTTTGTAQSSLLLPKLPQLVGVTFYHQMIPVELDAQGNWVAVNATNALRLTAGLF